MIEIKECDDYEAAKKLIKEYSKIKGAEAKRLYIKPECRGNGYARLLLNAMLDKCRELQFKEVRFTTKPEVMNIGYALYQKMGFEELENDNGTVLMHMMLDKD